MDFTLLNSVGINTDSAVQRFMGNEGLYARMLKKFLDDKTYEMLTESVSARKGDEALAASHTLKGLCGNLSLDELFALFSEQVTLMRADKWDEAYAMMTEISGKFKKTTETIRTWLEAQ